MATFENRESCLTRLLLCQIPLIALALIAVYTSFTFIHKYGPWLTPDTANYFSTATSLSAGEGFVQYDGAPLTQWAPFYPMILAAMELALGLKPFASTQILNAVLFGAIIYLGGTLFFRHLESPLLALAGTLTLLFSRPLFENTIQGMSETPFIFLLLSFFLLFELYQEKPRVWKLVLAGIAISLAALTRYIGFVLLPVGVICIWFLTAGTRRDRIRSVILFTLFSLSFIGVWIVRNFMLTGAPFGGRGQTGIPVAKSISLFFDVVFKWYAPNTDSTSLIAFLMLGAIAAALLALGERTNWRGVRSAVWKHGYLVIFSMCYVVLLIYQEATTILNPVDNRFLSPLVIPFGVLILVVLETILHRMVSAPVFLFATVILSVAIVGWIPYPQSDTKAISDLYLAHHGVGWNNSYWNSSFR